MASLFSRVTQTFHGLLNKQVDISALYTPVAASSTRIPNVVHQTWKHPRLPRRHAKAVATFRELNPEYSFEFHDDERMNTFMRTHYKDHPILAVYERINIMAAKADIWRYCLLFRQGGVYCDIDSALAVPLRSLLADDPAELLSFEGNSWKDQLQVGKHAAEGCYASGPSAEVRALLDHPDKTILNWLLCFEAGHPILEEVIGLIVENSSFFLERQFDDVWRGVIHSTGPLALTQAVWRHMERTHRRPTQAGIDFNGAGIFKLKDSDKRYVDSPHYVRLKTQRIAAPQPGERAS